MACSKSPSIVEDRESDLDNVAFVVVSGVDQIEGRRTRPEVVRWPLLWESDGVLQKQSPRSCLIKFNPGFDPTAVEELSPTLFDSMARNLLEFVSSEQPIDGSSRIIFVCENLGGIVVKKALTLASGMASYTSVVRNTYACVFFGVPHQAPTLYSWSEAIAGVI
ncbi:hypothetical protein F4820DRAFT_129706 [Hypoxylon rubiginosum]|uniref:Uncharacterized protein n=1 Tax=Hypoxylon rubiginosum TaxID=110542 RepID=A0ACB9YM35_9PEZI|nr:hypothetical protein F4820DRAFT_129706 [Hypoxylon rubiginosum]